MLGSTSPSGTEIWLVGRDLSPLRRLAEGEVECICDRESDAGTRLVRSIYDDRTWLRCGCGVVFHISGGVHLARNPGQRNESRDECGLCRAYPYRGGPGRRSPQPPPGGEGPLGPVIPPPRRKNGRRDPGEIRRGSGGGVRREGLWRVLRHVLKASGFLSLDRLLTPAEIWKRVREVLELDPLDPAQPDGPSLYDLCWTPATERSLHARVAELLRVWPLPDQNPEIWIFGIITHRPTSTDRWVNCRISGDGDPVEIGLRAHAVNLIGKKGPYIVVAASRCSDAGIEHHQLVGHAIASIGFPAPVESRYEAQVAHMLRLRRIRYYKPLEAFGRTRPDFLLPEHRVVIEVMGFADAEYLEEKERAVALMSADPLLAGWRLLKYEPHQRRETLSGFERRLSAVLGGRAEPDLHLGRSR
jgi:very-short-patch-repair endonuclease